MDNNINIAEILKDHPKGMRLYSPLLGNITLEKVDTNSTVPIRVMNILQVKQLIYIKIINMNQKEAVEFLPIVQALADGKPIEVLNCDGTWSVNRDLYFDKSIKCYRIKPEPKYRPFKNKEECLEEMQKHQPFGWIKSEKLLMNITSIGEGITVNTSMGNCGYSFKSAFSITFIDGTPFGIKIF